MAPRVTLSSPCFDSSQTPILNSQPLNSPAQFTQPTQQWLYYPVSFVWLHGYVQSHPSMNSWSTLSLTESCLTGHVSNLYRAVRCVCVCISYEWSSSLQSLQSVKDPSSSSANTASVCAEWVLYWNLEVLGVWCLRWVDRWNMIASTANAHSKEESTGYATKEHTPKKNVSHKWKSTQSNKNWFELVGYLILLCT